MLKALLISTVSRQFTLFEKDNIRILKKLGYQVHCAANFSKSPMELDSLGIIKHHVDIQRSPYSIKNIKAFFQLGKIMKEGNYDLVHCHAPMGGFLGRLCANITRVPRVIYTAHGFHFYKGAPLTNFLIYKNIERIAARWTDCLITINNEDYSCAQNFNLKNNGKVEYVPGVGVDVEKISNLKVDRIIKRRELGINVEDFLIVSVGELNYNKNHKQTIQAISILPRDIIENTTFAVCGEGNERENLINLAEKQGVKLKLLGYRSDVLEILGVADAFIFTSIREGLPKSLMEAMSVGLPVIATRIRGNIDLIKNGVNGLLVDCADILTTSQSIEQLINHVEMRDRMSKHNIKHIQNFSLDVVGTKMMRIYLGSK